VVCNRSQSNLSVSLAERNNLERTFFQSIPWSKVPDDQAGISALKARLNKLLIDLTRENFRDVAADITQSMSNCYERLQALGPERSSKFEQRSYLLRTATSFQYLVSHALDAYYGRDAVFTDHDELRLATVVKELQEDFSRDMRLHGHTREFRGTRRSLDTNSTETELSDDSDIQSSKDQESVLILKADSDRRAELRRALTNLKKPVDRPHEDIDSWIRREYNRSKGFEIGTINPSLLPALYHEQMKFWRFYTMQHVDKVIEATHSFIFSLLSHVCPDAAVRDRVWARLIDPLLQSYEKAIDHAKLLLQIEELGNMRTLNHYFADTLKKLRLARFQKRLENSMSWSTQDERKDTLVRLNDVLNIQISNEDQAIEDLHDILQSYYKLARKQFVDAVSKGAVDYFLLTVNDGPLRVCSAEFVGRLSDKELDEIAGENAESAAERANIKRQLRNLEEGQEVLKT
jgi:Dynamin central region/Dynamin GTPase effector domain